jgi:Tn3 transposase DDE domain
MLALHILQAALVYVNTLMIQDILAEPEWVGVLTAEDLRGLTPNSSGHTSRPYDEVKLNMTRRLALSVSPTGTPAGRRVRPLPLGFWCPVRPARTGAR